MEATVVALQALHAELAGRAGTQGGVWSKFRTAIANRPRERTPVAGLYLWGGVGRGKTWLMDLFFESLPFEEKLRLHFHRFMRGVHDALQELDEHTDPLRTVAERIARRARVICFDEFHVSDIADAMILGRLFEWIFRYGVTLVATSNVRPQDLYKDGLQRARFLPAIAMLEKHTRVMNVDGGVDYRLRVLERAGVYHTPLGERAEAKLLEEFSDIACGETLADVSVEIEGRLIPARRQCEGAIWFDFEAICDGPRSQADYIEIARQYHSVVVSDVPILYWDRDNAARRFIALVDEFYDRNVRLILSAEAPLEALYQGKRLAFEFERTRSRLQEMQSHDYLARPHIP